MHECYYFLRLLYTLINLLSKPDESATLVCSTRLNPANQMEAVVTFIFAS